MKIAISIIAGFSLLVLMSFTGGDKTVKGEDGIQFFHGTFAEAKAKAKKEHKLIFMDAYTTWCGPCKLMAKKSFTNKKVGELFNEKYVSIKVDMEKGEGPDLKKKYHVRAYPSIYLIDAEGKVVKEAVGYHPPSELIIFGTRD